MTIGLDKEVRLVFDNTPLGRRVILALDSRGTLHVELVGGVFDRPELERINSLVNPQRSKDFVLVAVSHILGLDMDEPMPSEAFDLFRRICNALEAGAAL